MNKIKSQLRAQCGLVSLVVAAAAAPAQAQTAPTDVATESQASSAEEGMQDIVVTARKRDERLQDVPVAISAYTATELKRYSTQSIAQIATQTPQLVAQSSPGSSGGGVISLRGVGSANTGPGIDQAVSVVVDGIQISRGQALRLGLHDLERLEILKGPQALFYGKNSPGGIISIISADPTSEPEFQIRSGYEVFAEQKYIEAIASGPLSDTLRARIDGFFSKENGWFRNDAKPLPSIAIPAALGGGDTTAGVGTRSSTGPRQQNYFLRGTLAFQPSDRFDVKAKVAYSNLNQKNGLGFGQQLFGCPFGAPALVVLLGSNGSRDCRINRFTNDADAPPAVARLDPLFNNGRLYVKNDQLLASLTVNADITDNIKVTSVSGYYRLHEQYTGNFSYGDQAYLVGAGDVRTRQFSQELRVNTDFTSPFNVMVGGYYQHDNLTYRNPAAVDDPITGFFSGGFLSGPILLVNPLARQATDAWSIFGQGILDVTDQVQVTAGGRFSREKKSFALTILPHAFTPVAYDPALTRDRRSFKNFSPEVTLTYKPITELTVYAAYRKGFKSGGFDLNATTGGFGTVTLPDISFGQEIAEGGEIGAKGSVLDRQLQFDLSLYSFKYSGLQVSAFNSAVLGYQVTNAGSARVKGVDFSLQFRPMGLRGLSLRAAAAYNPAKYLSFESSPCYGGQSKAAGCNLIASASGVRPAGAAEVANAQDLSGRPLTRAPKWAFSAGGSYDTHVGGGMKLSLSGDAIYTDQMFVEPEQDPRSVARAVWRFNANIGFGPEDDRWQIALIGRNLTNRLRPIEAISIGGTGGETGTNNGGLPDKVGSVSEPRTVALQATFNF